MEEIKKAQIWEDGLRTDPTKKSFEWWYFDANFTDGSTVVITFFTKSPSNPGGPQTPQVTLTVTTPTGEKKSYTKFYTPADFKAEKDQCNVVIGKNTIVGDLKTYKIHIDLEGITGDFEFDQIAPSYSTASSSPKTEYFGWFCAIPYGKTSGTLTIDGKTQNLTGTGYHDHNWGIVNIKDVCSYWYWGRGNADDYSMIFTVMVLPKILGGKHVSLFYLAKDTTALIANSDHLELTKTDITPPDPKANHLPQNLTFTYTNEGKTIEFALSNFKLIESLDPLAGESGWKKFLTRLFSKPLYVRYNAIMNLTVEGKQIPGTSLFEIMILH